MNGASCWGAICCVRLGGLQPLSVPRSHMDRSSTNTQTYGARIYTSVLIIVNGV